MDAIERELGRVLVDVAEDVEIPPCDANALVLSGRREIHRSRVRGAWWGVASAAAVAMVVVGGSLAIRWSDSAVTSPDHDGQVATHAPTTAPPTAPPTLTALPRGSAPNIPYWSRGVYHLGGHKQLLAMPTIRSMNGATLVTVSTANGKLKISLVDGSDLVPISSDANSWPVLSPDGRLAAWETTGHGSLTRLVLWNLTTNSQVATTEFPSQAHCCDAPSTPVGIDGEGRVYVWDGGAPLMWDPGVPDLGEIFALPKALQSDLSGANVEGPVFMDSTFGDKADAGSVYGTVDADRIFHQAGRFPSQQAVWSPDGGHVAYQLVNGSMVVRDTKTRATVPLGLPRGEAAFSTWEDDSHLLVTMSAGRRTYWIRCDLETGRAEIAAVLTGERSLVLPS